MLKEAPEVVGTESVLTFPEETGEGSSPGRPSPAPGSWFPLAAAGAERFWESGGLRSSSPTTSFTTARATCAPSGTGTECC